MQRRIQGNIRREWDRTWLFPFFSHLGRSQISTRPARTFIEAIDTAQGAHDDPLLVAISTQAATDGDLFSIWLDDAAHAKDQRIISHFYTAPKDCQIPDKKAWRVANPALGTFRSLQDIKDFSQQADRLPAKANSF